MRTTQTIIESHTHSWHSIISMTPVLQTVLSTYNKKLKQDCHRVSKKIQNINATTSWYSNNKDFQNHYRTELNNSRLQKPIASSSTTPAQNPIILHLLPVRKTPIRKWRNTTQKSSMQHQSGYVGDSCCTKHNLQQTTTGILQKRRRNPSLTSHFSGLDGRRFSHWTKNFS